MARVYKRLTDDVFSGVLRRVVYRLISDRYRINPQAFANYPPRAVYDLGQEYRMLFPALYPWFLFFSKNMAGGLSTTFLRDCKIEDAPRAVHKRRVHRVR